MRPASLAELGGDAERGNGLPSLWLHGCLPIQQHPDGWRRCMLLHSNVDALDKKSLAVRRDIVFEVHGHRVEVHRKCSMCVEKRLRGPTLESWRSLDLHGHQLPVSGEIEDLLAIVPPAWLRAAGSR